mmetsp:Transcript_82777/g.232055  ORF Transcript_82777/g.232055 Transcript_82777/m.232055 type:complete len:201 (+) Transcript_82777:1100-1702(+)
MLRILSLRRGAGPPWRGLLAGGAHAREELPLHGREAALHLLHAGLLHEGAHGGEVRARPLPPHARGGAVLPHGVQQLLHHRLDDVLLQPLLHLVRMGDARLQARPHAVADLLDVGASPGEAVDLALLVVEAVPQDVDGLPQLPQLRCHGGGGLRRRSLLADLCGAAGRHRLGEERSVGLAGEDAQLAAAADGREAARAAP